MATYSTDKLTGGTVSASGETTPAVRACDNDAGTFWAHNTMPTWWKYDFGAGILWIIEKITIKARSDGTNVQFKDFILKGSTNDSTWVNVYTGQVANNENVQAFTFSNTNSYRYYQIAVSSSWGTAYTQAFEFEMMVDITPKGGILAWFYNS